MESYRYVTTISKLGTVSNKKSTFNDRNKFQKYVYPYSLNFYEIFWKHRKWNFCIFQLRPVQNMKWVLWKLFHGKTMNRFRQRYKLFSKIWSNIEKFKRRANLFSNVYKPALDWSKFLKPYKITYNNIPRKYINIHYLDFVDCAKDTTFRYSM